MSLRMEVFPASDSACCLFSKPAIDMFADCPLAVDSDEAGLLVVNPVPELLARGILGPPDLGLFCL